MNMSAAQEFIKFNDATVTSVDRVNSGLCINIKYNVTDSKKKRRTKIRTLKVRQEELGL